ncbi:hypothetical protein SLS58_007132 [Diplodia intermedia]|uniref:Protein kinase domain-containing protein n=1 Tax=Diplodia intermedia TaxID=856260 RepID=A0ABR3TL04_9PEZI
MQAQLRCSAAAQGFDLFDAEREAYLLMRDTESLHGRVHEDSENPAILLQLVPGVREQIAETLFICHDIGLYHRTLPSDSIVFDGKHARLMGFSHSRRRFRMKEWQREAATEMDTTSLELIFLNFAIARSSSPPYSETSPILPKIS